MQLDVAWTFPISVPLINLLRNPALDNHRFEPTYLESLKQLLTGLGKEKNESSLEIVLYIHLILAQV